MQGRLHRTRTAHTVAGVTVIPASHSGRNPSGADYTFMDDQRVTAEHDQDAGTRAAFLAVRNTGLPFMSETVGVARLGGGLAFAWSWGQRIGDASDPGAAALAIAYVLEARGVRLGGPSPARCERVGHEGSAS